MGSHRVRHDWNDLAAEGTNLNIIKAIYDQHTANMILNGENMKAFLLNSEKKQHGRPLSPLLPKMVLEVLATTVSQKKIKCIQTGKRENCHYLQMPRYSTHREP